MSRRKVLAAIAGLTLATSLVTGIATAGTAQGVTPLPTVNASGSYQVGSGAQLAYWHSYAPLPGHTTETVSLDPGVAAGMASMVELNFVGVDSVGSGWITVYPHGSLRPGSMNMYFHKGVSSQGMVLVAPGVNNEISITGVRTRWCWLSG